MLLSPTPLRDSGGGKRLQQQIYQLALLHRLQTILSKIIDQTDADKNIDEHKKTIAMTNENMQPTYRGFDGIIGQSHLLLNVFDQIMQVAPFDTSGVDTG